MKGYEEGAWKTIDWAPDLDAALDRARREEKPILVVFAGRYLGEPVVPDI